MEEKPKTKEEVLNAINEIIDDKYKYFRIKGKELFKSRSKSHTVGKDVDDVVQQGILNFIDWVRKKLDKCDIERFVEDKLNENYVYKSVVVNIKREFWSAERKQGIRNKTQKDVKAQYLSSNPFEDFEQVEVDEFKQEISGVKRTLVRMLEEGKRVQDIIDRLDISSVEKYYDIINSLKKQAREKGYVKDE